MPYTFAGHLASRPDDFLTRLNRLSPGLWRKMDQARSKADQWSRDFILPTWACPTNDLVKLDANDPSDGSTLQEVERLAPGSAAYYAARGIRTSDPVLTLTQDRAAMLYAWRSTKMEFRFDPDLAAELLDTPIAGDIPADLLNRLPATCIYVGASLMEGMGEWAGFYAFLDQPSRNALPVLKIFRDQPGRWPSLVFTIPVSGGSLAVAMRQRHEDFVEKFGGMLHTLNDPEQALKQKVLRERKDLVEYEIRMAGMLLSLLLYLCSEKPDLPDNYEPTTLRQKVAGSLRRITPPTEVRCWPVGIRLGAVFRKSDTAQKESGESDKASHEGSATIVRPHIRRAHWHTYWIGPKGHAKAILRWVSPVVVGARSAGDAFPTVIRPVSV